ncbi:MAG: hypothetical protein HFJ07_15720 [Lachnospiraceae bacterium]|jgi:hypothetical protein|nr:hypothetical protein [Lachnospiraceae bacterium]
MLVRIAPVGGLLIIGGCTSSKETLPSGYQDYKIQKGQYFVEYSEKYDYWDVLTIEYPVLQDIETEQVAAINDIFYKMAMEKVNYWHLEPDTEVKELQKEYSIFSSDVHCEVPYHSQHLVSVHFQEAYAPISPVHYIHMTERAANVDLTTGKNYTLSDILTINEDFSKLWCQQAYASGDYGDMIQEDDDTYQTILAWFLGEDQETAENYLLTPFYYLDENKDFVIGIAYDPKANIVVNDLPMDNYIAVHIESDLLAPYQTESEFWNLYNASETAGTVLECADRKDNIWLGKEAGVWDYLESHGR